MKVILSKDTKVCPYMSLNLNSLTKTEITGKI